MLFILSIADIAISNLLIFGEFDVTVAEAKLVGTNLCDIIQLYCKSDW